VFRAADVVGRGLLTPHQLHSSAWRRLFRGVFADADLPDDHGLRIAGASLVVPPSAVYSGRTAGYLLGARSLADAGTPVEVTVPRSDRFGPVTGLVVRTAALTPGEVDVGAPYRCTTGLRTALDLARCGPLVEAVVAVDALLAAAVVGRRTLVDAADALSTGRGSRQARRVAALADGRAQSPPETRVRVALRLAGLDPVPQHIVRSASGAFLAQVDLAFPQQRVAVEYDGAHHGRAEQFRRDRARLNRLVEAGWVVLHVTAGDLADLPGLVSRVRNLLAGR
jgi:very-short-patch-repair endonuclease